MILLPEVHISINIINCIVADKADEVLNTFNIYHPKLNFTIETTTGFTF